MDNETAIHIATKVWGMTSSQMAKEYSWEHNNCNFNEAGAQTYSQYWESQVNSWQGFGRTVEAMAEKKWEIMLTNVYGEAVIFQSRPRLKYKSGKCRLKKSGDGLTYDTIEATHLAALSAVREDKKD